jgi:hypothetical protein
MIFSSNNVYEDFHINPSKHFVKAIAYEELKFKVNVLWWYDFVNYSGRLAHHE